MTGAQLLRDSIYEKNKVDIDFEKFKNHTLFKMILKKSKNEEVFLNMAKECISG